MFDGDWAPGLFLGLGVPRGVIQAIQPHIFEDWIERCR